MATISKTAPAVFITVPKYVAITPSINGSQILPKIRAAPSTTQAEISSTTSGYASSVSDDGPAPKGKKRRLDHLSWEEKVQRKKLKNRVAAQTSRDRKKARMEDMEHEINELTERTELLQNKCDSMQAMNEALMEKNQKLDKEVELLRQQLTEWQQQQSSQHRTLTATCAGSAGINKQNGLTVDRSSKADGEEQYSSSSLADCSSLPTLQDMLVLDLINNTDEEQFDASNLEELAESLLADITADLEASNRASDEAATETTSGTECLPGSVVGTKTECLESSEDSKNNSSICLSPPQQSTAEDTIKVENTEKLNGNYEQLIEPTTITTATTTIPLTTEFAYTTDLATPETVYGTYDAKTNSITIVMDDDSFPVNEAVEEIYCDGVTPPASDDVIKCLTPSASPAHVYLNLNIGCDTDDDDDVLNFDPISKFLCPKRPLISPLAKSPAHSFNSVNSDHGYESIIGSPPHQTTIPLTEEAFEGIEEFSWQDNSFNELFPALI